MKTLQIDSCKGNDRPWYMAHQDPSKQLDTWQLVVRQDSVNHGLSSLCPYGALCLVSSCRGRVNCYKGVLGDLCFHVCWPEKAFNKLKVPPYIFVWLSLTGDCINVLLSFFITNKSVRLSLREAQMCLLFLLNRHTLTGLGKEMFAAWEYKPWINRHLLMLVMLNYNKALN